MKSPITCGLTGGLLGLLIAFSIGAAGPGVATRDLITALTTTVSGKQDTLTQNSSVTLSNVTAKGYLTLSGQTNRITVTADGTVQKDAGDLITLDTNQFSGYSLKSGATVTNLSAAGYLTLSGETNQITMASGVLKVNGADIVAGSLPASGVGVLRDDGDGNQDWWNMANAYQATNAALTALAADPAMYQATNAALTALATDPAMYQATNAALTALVDNPAMYQATNDVLTAASTNSFTGTGTIPLSSVTDAKQDTNAVLTALIGNPAMYQATNDVLTALSTNSFTGTGTVPLSSVTDGKQAAHANLTSLANAIALVTGDYDILMADGTTNRFQFSAGSLTNVVAVGP